MNFKGDKFQIFKVLEGNFFYLSFLLLSIMIMLFSKMEAPIINIIIYKNKINPEGLNSIISQMEPMNEIIPLKTYIQPDCFCKLFCKLGFVCLRIFAPQFGHVVQSSEISAPQSLHLINPIML